MIHPIGELSSTQKPRSLVARWRRKFRDAIDGAVCGVMTESSLRVHLFFAVAAIGVATLMRVEPWRWSVILLCIAIVISAEYFNSALEHLVRVLHPGHDTDLAKALHFAAAGVLVASFVAVIVGLIVLAPPAMELFAG